MYDFHVFSLIRIENININLFFIGYYRKNVTLPSSTTSLPPLLKPPQLYNKNNNNRNQNSLPFLVSSIEPRSGATESRKPKIVTITSYNNNNNTNIKTYQQYGYQLNREERTFKNLLQNTILNIRNNNNNNNNNKIIVNYDQQQEQNHHHLLPQRYPIHPSVQRNSSSPVYKISNDGDIGVSDDDDQYEMSGSSVVTSRVLLPALNLISEEEVNVSSPTTTKVSSLLPNINNNYKILEIVSKNDNQESTTFTTTSTPAEIVMMTTNKTFTTTIEPNNITDETNPDQKEEEQQQLKTTFQTLPPEVFLTTQHNIVATRTKEKENSTFSSSIENPVINLLLVQQQGLPQIDQQTTPITTTISSELVNEVEDDQTKLMATTTSVAFLSSTNLVRDTPTTASLNFEDNENNVFVDRISVANVTDSVSNYLLETTTRTANIQLEQEKVEILNKSTPSPMMTILTSTEATTNFFQYNTERFISQLLKLDQLQQEFQKTKTKKEMIQKENITKEETVSHLTTLIPEMITTESFLLSTQPSATINTTPIYAILNTTFTEPPTVNTEKAEKIIFTYVPITKDDITRSQTEITDLLKKVQDTISDEFVTTLTTTETAAIETVTTTLTNKQEQDQQRDSKLLTFPFTQSIQSNINNRVDEQQTQNRNFLINFQDLYSNASIFDDLSPVYAYPNINNDNNNNIGDQQHQQHKQQTLLNMNMNSQQNDNNFVDSIRQQQQSSLWFMGMSSSLTLPLSSSSLNIDHHHNDKKVE